MNASTDGPRDRDSLPVVAILGVPADPADLERLPPADLDTCPVCKGATVVIDELSRDPMSGLYSDLPCPRCDGTGTI